jgi:hypothetical protein
VQDCPEIGIASEHGYRIKEPGSDSFTVTYPNLNFGWKDIVRPIMQVRPSRVVVTICSLSSFVRMIGMHAGAVSLL